MNFLKIFLAALLAVVVGSILTFLFWLVLFFGVAGSMESVSTVNSNSILKIDMAEIITDSPSIDPFASIDFATMQTTYRLPLLRVLRSIE
ncbi:MAG: signal peptide peptidase SppA, partial [Alistipes sp.]